MGKNTALQTNPFQAHRRICFTAESHHFNLLPLSSPKYFCIQNELQRPKFASNLLENPKASLPGLMKEPKSSVNSPRLFSMYGLPEDEDEDEDEDEVWWKLRSDR